MFVEEVRNNMVTYFLVQMGLALLSSSQSQVVFSILRVLGFFSSPSSSTLASSSSSTGLTSSSALSSSSIGSSTSAVYNINSIEASSVK